MALTKKDIQLITEALQPRLDQLKKELMNEFAFKLQYEIKGVKVMIEALRIYMETRFRDVEHRIDALEKHTFLLNDSDK